MPLSKLTAALAKAPANTVEDIGRRIKLKRTCTWLANFYAVCDSTIDNEPAMDQFRVIPENAICDDPRAFIVRFDRAFRLRQYEECAAMVVPSAVWTYCNNNGRLVCVTRFAESVNAFASHCEDSV